MDTNGTGKSFFCSRCGTTFHFECEGGCQVCQMCFNSRALCSECFTGRAGITLGPPENPIWLINEAGSVRVEFVNLGEGNCGDFDPSDTDDVNLLRFEVSIRQGGSEWVDPGDASYCTQMPAGTSGEVLAAALLRIMGDIEEPLLTGSSIKKACEALSWMEPGWFKDLGASECGNRYEVLVTRTSHASRNITVTALSADDAKRVATDRAGDLIFSEHDADYDADAVRELVTVGVD